MRVNGSNSAGADELLLLGPGRAAAGIYIRRPCATVLARPAHDGGVAGQRDGGAEGGSSNAVGGGQLLLLGPGSAAANEDIRRPCATSPANVLARPAHDGGVPVGGQRDRGAEGGSSSAVGGGQLLLLGPGSAAAGEDPGRPCLTVVGRPAQDGRVAVGGHRDGPALLGGSTSAAGADQLRPLLRELRQR